MKYRLTITSFILFVYTISFAQTTDEDVKKHIVKLLNDQYKQFIYLGSPTSNPKQIATAKETLLKAFQSEDVLVVNDLDSTTSRPDFITAKQYFDSYRETSPLGIKSKFYTNKGSGLGVYVDKERNAYTYKYTVRKINQYTKLIEKLDNGSSLDTTYYIDPETNLATDSILSIDSSATGTAQIDTIKVPKARYLDIYFHMDFKEGRYQNIKIAAISLARQKPQYPELDDLTKWWVSLDEKWQKLVSEELELPKVPSPYYLKMVSGIQRLILTDAQMDTWEPLSQFKNVSQLKLEGANIDNLSYLKPLSKLSAVNLNKTKITSLEGINASSLEFLFASDLGLSNIDALAGSRNLIEIDISGNDIVSLEPLKGNTKLEELYCNANEITDLSPLANLKALEILHCGKNKEITSLAPLRSHYNLVELDIFNTGVTTLKDIAGLQKIYRLDISFTKVNSLLPLRHLKYLTYLAFSGNNLDNYGVLDGFQYLKTLKCAQTNISDISPINRMKGLLVLYAPYTEFSKNDIQRFKKNHPKCAITYY